MRGTRHASGLLKLIGRGGFANVWQALDRQTHRGHRGFHYFIMDFVSGGDLLRGVLKRSIEREAALRAVLQVGAALSYAHQRELIHRDVKPENILLDGAGNAHLADFDLVWAPDSTGNTRTGAMGTFLYAAPEVMADASRVDCRADVYSLAMTAVFALHGRKLGDQVVYERDDFFDALQCAAPLKALLRRGTARKPEDRHGTVELFCAELQRLSAQVGPYSRPPPESSSAELDVRGKVRPQEDSAAKTPPGGTNRKGLRRRNLAAAAAGLAAGALYGLVCLRAPQAPTSAPPRKVAADLNLSWPPQQTAPAVPPARSNTRIWPAPDPAVLEGPEPPPSGEAPAVPPTATAPVEPESRARNKRRLRAAEKARKKGRCDEFDSLIKSVLHSEPDNAKARKAKERPCP